MHLGAILVRTMTAQGRSKPHPPLIDLDHTPCLHPSALPELMVMVAELQSLGFGHHVYEGILHSLQTRQDNRDQAMADALTVLQDMLRHVRVM